jgi:DNA-binding transcriptional MerR regulator
VPRRISQTRQLDFFQQTPLYLSQSDAARALGLTVRVIQYWESQGLLHPELPSTGRARRYTERDLVELHFIKSLVIDQGFQVVALAEKLRQLEAPYDYDPLDIFWDPRDLCWKSRRELAAEVLTASRPGLDEVAGQALDTLSPLESAGAARFLLDFLRDWLLDRRPRKRRRG